MLKKESAVVKIISKRIKSYMCAKKSRKREQDEGQNGVTERIKKKKRRRLNHGQSVGFQRAAAGIAIVIKSK